VSRYGSSTPQFPGYKNAVLTHPVFTREQEQRLFDRYADGDESARGHGQGVIA
jgi:hypothetical protein